MSTPHPFRETDVFTSYLLVVSFVYLIMCPFAHALTSENGSPVLLPQKQMTETYAQQKASHPTPCSPAKGYQPDTCMLHCPPSIIPFEHSQEPLLSLSLITTSRLIL